MQGDEGATPQDPAAQAPAASPPCAVHPDRPATGICQRCGNYTCGLCTEEGRQAMCAACRQRLGLMAFPMSRERWSVEDLVSYAWYVFKREWAALTVASLIFLGVLYSVAIAFGLGQGLVEGLVHVQLTTAEMVALSGTQELIQLVLQGWLQLGLLAMTIDALQGRPVRVSMVFGQYRKIGKFLVQWLVVLLGFALALGPIGGGLFWWLFHREGSLPTAAIVALVVGGLLVFAALAYVGLGLFFMQVELALDDEVGPLEAIRRSWVISRGKRGWVLLVGIIAGVVAMSGVAACCIGLFPTFAIGELIVTGLFLALRNGAGVPEVAPAARATGG